jgi:hypothetical protein
LRWWLRDPVTRAGFLLTSAYLVRDREVKLRVYPGIAPLLALPLISLFQPAREADVGTAGFMAAFCGVYAGMVPMMALSMLQHSEQWQASDVFRAAPLPGPARLCVGARRSVLLVLTLPSLAILGLISALVLEDRRQLLLLAPGFIAVPLFALVPFLNGKGVPLSMPQEDAKSAQRALPAMGIMVSSAALSGTAVLAWSMGWFAWFLAAEALIAFCLHAALRHQVSRVRWPSME